MTNYNLRSPAVKRLMREAQELSQPTELYYAQPIEDNLFEWHFTIRGPEGSEFEGGIYHGQISLPTEYPMKPPNIMLLTPNGRFEQYRQICLSISGYHPETWCPSWSIRTALLAIIGFMPTSGAGAIGSMSVSIEERKKLAIRSQNYSCDICGPTKNLLLPLTSASSSTAQEAKEVASQFILTEPNPLKESTPPPEPQVSQPAEKPTATFGMPQVISQPEPSHLAATMMNGSLKPAYWLCYPVYLVNRTETEKEPATSASGSTKKEPPLSFEKWLKTVHEHPSSSEISGNQSTHTASQPPKSSHSSLSSDNLRSSKPSPSVDIDVRQEQAPNAESSSTAFSPRKGSQKVSGMPEGVSRPRGMEPVDSTMETTEVVTKTDPLPEEEISARRPKLNIYTDPLSDQATGPQVSNSSDSKDLQNAHRSPKSTASNASASKVFLNHDAVTSPNPEEKHVPEVTADSQEEVEGNRDDSSSSTSHRQGSSSSPTTIVLDAGGSDLHGEAAPLASIHRESPMPTETAHQLPSGPTPQRASTSVTEGPRVVPLPSGSACKERAQRILQNAAEKHRRQARNLMARLEGTEHPGRLEEFNENPGEMYVPPSVEKMLGICNPKPASFHSGMQRSAFNMSIAGRDFYRYNQDIRYAPSFDQLTPAQQLEELHSRPHPANMYDLRHVTTLEIAERSLMSGLPNEIDLSLNSILFLSAVVQHSPSTPLRFSSCRNLLQLMLATVGIYEDGPGSLRPMRETWTRACNLDFDEFWQNAVGDWVLSFLHNDAYLYEEHSEPLVQDAETAGYRVVPPPSPETTHDLFSPSSLDNTRTLFGRISPGDHCLSTNAALSRVLMVVATLVNSVTPPYLANMPPPLEEDDDEIEQVMAFASAQGRRASISGCGTFCSGDMVGGRLFRGRSLYPAAYLPPLSSWRDNTRFLSSQPCALRFAFLCAYARHSTLRQLGLQLISSLRYPLVPNVLSSGAVQKIPRPLHDNTFTGIELISVRFLVRCLIQSDDRCDLLAGLNLLTNLLRVPEGINVERLFAGLPRSLWCRLIQLLCLSDLGLVCAVLEVLHTATGMGGVACTRLWSALASADDTISPLAPSTVFAPRRASSHLRPLLALLSLEGQAMGPGSLHRVKVVPRYPPPQPQQQYYHHPRYQYHPSSHLVASRSPYPTLPPHQHCQQQQQQSQQQPIIRPLLPPPSNPHSMTLPSNASVPQTPSSLASLLGPGNDSSAASVSPCMVQRSGPTMSLPVPPQLANVRPKPSSLSELTDRLVMPPPKEPPPRRQSSKVNGAVAGGSTSSSPCRTPLVNGKVHNNPPPNSVSNHRLPSCYHPHQISSNELQQQKSSISSKSLLEEVLNNPSNKALQTSSPPLVNGCVSRTSGVTIHHTGTRKDVDGNSNLSSMKMVNGETVVKSKDPVKQASQMRVNKKHETSALMVNGVFHEQPDFMKKSKALKSVKKEQAVKKDNNEEEEEEDEDEASTEASLIESATIFTHQLRYNRKVGFYYTRKRPRNFAVRNRVFDTPPPSASFSVKRQKMMDRKSEERAAMLTVEQGKKVPSIHQPPPPPPLMFVCEWSGCFRQFSEASQVYGHVYNSHVKQFIPPPNAFKTSRHPLERKCCLWNDCPTAHVPRAPYSLQSHVLDFHCSAVELESRRRLMPLRGDFDPASSAAPSTQQQQPVQLYFPPDQSGWAIIRDVETRRLQSDLWVSQCAISGGRYLVPPVAAPRNMLLNQPLREGPVTKHLRVTAALILRNLAKYVPEARQWLSSETQLLCEIAMGTCPGVSSLRSNDAGHIIAQCLFLCSSLSSSSDSSFPIIPRRIIGGSGDDLEAIDTYCSFGLSETDEEIYEYFYDDDLDGTDSRLAVLQRLALLRQRSAVDLDA
ncbi:hypothetical protein Aperf_G00000109388 [Anoplocephala perfoliata]